MKRQHWALLGILTVFAIGCGDKSASTSGETTGTAPGTTGKMMASGDKPLVFFSQANSRDPWRKVFDADAKAEAAKHADEFSFEEQDADGDASKQNDTVNTVLVRQPKVILISPTEESVRPSIEKAFDAGIPVILLDRSIEGDKYTCWIGGDNVEIGRQAGEFIATKLNGKGTVLMIRGIAEATPTKERAAGAMESFKKYPGITVIEGNDCGYERIKARDYMQSFLQSGKPFDAVYAHNDEMAIGAQLAMEAAKTPKKIIVGIDACQQEVVDMIKAGKLDATFQYPTPGGKGVQVAAELLKGNKPDRRIVLPTVMVTKANADKYATDNPNLAK
jgi:ribose transport system substrate-binding protein